MKNLQMFAASIAILFSVFSTVHSTSSTNSCADIIRIESFGVLNYLANVTFPVPENLIEDQWEVDILTDIPFTFLGGWNVWVQNNEEEGKSVFRSRDTNVTLTKDDPLSFRFRISWFKGESVPKVISLKWQGIEICQDEQKKASAEQQQRNISRRRRTRNTQSGEWQRLHYRHRVQG